MADELDIAEFLRTIWRRRWMVFGTILLVTGLAVLIVFQLTPIYTATARVMIDPRRENVVDIQSVLSGLNPDAAMIASEVQVITSRSLAERVVRELELDADPEFNKILAHRGQQSWRDTISSWLPEDWRAAVEDSTSSRPTSQDDLRRMELAAVIDDYLKSLTVSPVGRSYVINVAFESKDPFKAADVANKAADLYVLNQLEAKFEATARANQWLNERLEELRETVEASERALVAYRSEHKITNTEESDVVTQQVSELNTQLTLARAERAANGARLAQVDNLVKRGGEESAAEVLSSKLIQSLREEEAVLQRKMSELETRYGERHPRIINARAEAGELRTSIAREVRKIVQNLQNEVEVSRARERALEQDLLALKAESSKLEGASIKLNELQREADANRTLYNTFLLRFKETGQQQEIEQPDARIISRADIPDAPSFPKKSVIIGLALIASVGLGVFLVFVVERLDNGFRSGEQIEAFTAIPTLALIPSLPGGLRRRARPDKIVLEKPLSSFAESMRTLLTGIMLSDVDEPPRSLVITSSLPGEGKTLSALSLARVAALSGKRVLLIDCDLRRRHASGLINGTARSAAHDNDGAGLTDVLSKRVTFADALAAEDASGLCILRAGSPVPNPQNLMQSHSLSAMLETALKGFELVIMDSPPVLAVADALMLSAMADKTVFLIQWKKTPRKVAMNALRQLANAKAKIAGVALSQVNVRRHARYGFGDAGYYYGRYRDYYQE